LERFETYSRHRSDDFMDLEEVGEHMARNTCRALNDKTTFESVNVISNFGLNTLPMPSTSISRPTRRRQRPASPSPPPVALLCIALIVKVKVQGVGMG
jgi:hypothetical protein